MTKLLERINRWRHTHGFGVHSPFGYDLVTRAVHPVGCAWYGYANVDGAMGHDFDRKVRSQARMLLRIAAMLRPASAFLQQGSHPAYYAALNAADSRMKIHRLPKLAPGCDMVCSHHDFIPLEILKSVLASEGHWVVVRDTPLGWADALFESIPEGLMFTGPKNTFIIHRRGMQKVRYSMDIG